MAANRPDMVFIAPNSAFLPMIIGREMIKNEKIQSSFSLPKNYKPYMFFPKSRKYKMLSRGSYDSEPNINRIEMWMEEGDERAVEIYKEVEAVSETIRKQLEIRKEHDLSSAEPVRIMIFDESVRLGETARAMRDIVRMAIDLLVKKGVIADKENIKFTGSGRPFGEYKPQFPKIQLVENESNGTFTPKDETLNKLLFGFGKIIGKMSGEQEGIRYWNWKEGIKSRQIK